MSTDVCPLGHCRFLSQGLLYLPLFSVLGKKPQESKDSRSFQNLNQQLQVMWPFNK